MNTKDPNALNEFPLPVISDKAESRPLWRSLDEKNGAAGLIDAQKDEFPPGAGVLTGLDRRSFLQMIGGTLAVAGASACWRPPEENIYPYTRAPRDVTPGVPRHYASAFAMGGYTTGVIVESYDGRPIKVEGNEQHPSSLGATSAFEQAEVWRLYDPSRAREIVRNGQPKAFRGFLADVTELTGRYKQDGGAKLRFLTAPTSSPTIGTMRQQIQQQLPNARFYSWSPVSSQASREGVRAAFGRDLEPHYDLGRAQVILSLDSDFLMWEPERLRLSREFAQHRDPVNGLNRLYVAEPTMTMTGTNADHRLRIKTSQVQDLARALAASLAQGAPELGQFGGAQGLSDKQQNWIREVAKDLLAHRGRAVVLAGLRQPPAVHALVQAINGAIGAVGPLVRYTAPATLDVNDGVDGLRQLADEIRAGKVETLVIDAYNPVYTAPADIDFASLLANVKNTLYFHYYDDETAKACNWLVPMAHELEQWGDVRAPDGTASIIQPLIAPLFNGVAPVSLYAAFAGMGDQTPHQLVRTYWQNRTGGGADFENQWQSWLATGVIPNTGEAQQDVQVDMAGVSRAMQAARPAGGELELHFAPDYRVYDGRYANNAWLQELPDPVTKVTWDNPLLVSPATAKRLGVEQGDLVTLTVGERNLDVAVYVLPGQADDSVTLPLGFGRDAKMEKVAHGVGFNAYKLRTSDAQWFVPNVTVAKTGRTYALAITQDHWSMEGRDMALVGAADEKQLHDAIARNRDLAVTTQPEAAKLALVPMQEPVDYSDGYKWGMTIDLGRCIGCNACVIACQAENNVPTVGKDQVIRGREMHWLMIDRYFVGSDVEEPEVVTQPRMCVHCETAPCEYVCPVNATVHSDEGLNEMVYNRCIGTRYCSNNCPYKVRRFNYLHWQAERSATEQMAMNPEVTVRMRGVMEKCTYCVQRIQRVRISTRIEGRQIKDGDVVTACQQACPTNAIVFGNLNEAEAQVTKLHADKRRYDLLYSLGTRPRTGYLARIKNYNPALVSEKTGTDAEHH